METRGRRILAQYSPAPRAWQVTALERWQQSMRGTISVVTGGGKTIFAFMCMRNALKAIPQIRFIVVVPSVALLDQWCYSLQQDLGLGEGDIGSFSGETTLTEPKFVNVCIINTARDLVPRLASEGPWLLCVDECHRAGSPANSRALLGEFSAALGLSATPRRQYDDGFTRFVAPVLGPVIFEYGFDEALRDEVITPFRLENYRIPFTTTESKQFEVLTKSIAKELNRLRTQGSIESPRLKRLLQQRSSHVASAKWRVPCATLLALRFREPTIIFHERISAANSIAQSVQARGRRAVPYHSELPLVIRQRNLTMFRMGMVDTLVTCRSLDEGLNIPEAEVGIMAASTKSVRQRIQRLGRVLRRSPGKDRSVVCTLYVTDGEAALLNRERISLAEIAETRWYEMKVPHD